MSSNDRNAQGKYKIVFAHRVAYQEWVGPLEAEMTIDHLCGNTKCVNYKHLEQVTRAENIRRFWENKRKLAAQNTAQ